VNVRALDAAGIADPHLREAYERCRELSAEQFPTDLRQPATSLLLETGAPVERAVFIRYLLEELDLTRLAGSMAYTLSGGEKRRLWFGLVMVKSSESAFYRDE